jgi:hypothetical protein
MLRMLGAVVSSSFVFMIGCSRSPAPTEPTPAPASSVSSAAPARSTPSAAPPATAAASPPIAVPAPEAAGAKDTGYPVGRECSTAEAIAREEKTLAPIRDWQPVEVRKQGIRLRVPAGVFQSAETNDGLLLTSSQKARGLGPDAKARPFSLRVRRIARSPDDLLADQSKSSPLAGVYVEGAFPKRTTSSFVPQTDEPFGSGAAVRITVAGKPAWVWINGVEGYDTDSVLVELGSKDSLLITADWNSAIMGQPECWQRAIIGGVVNSITMGGSPK